MKKTVRTILGPFTLAVLLSSSGCSKAMPDARRDHILAADHGWISLTLTAPVAAPGYTPDRQCHLSFQFNGETVLAESADLAQAAANTNPVGYRMVVPAGILQTRLVIESCVKDALVLTLPLPLEKDHLADLMFDGASLVLKGSTPYQPTSLEWVRTEMLKLGAANAASNAAAHAAVSTLTWIAIGSLALNALALLLFVWMRWRRPA